MTEVNCKKYYVFYIKVFVAMNVCLIAASFALDHFFNVEMPGFASFLVLMLCAFMTGQKFTEDRNRLPDLMEKTKLIRISFLITFVIQMFITSIVLVSLNFLGELDAIVAVFQELGMGVTIGIFLFVFLMQYLSLKLGYGYMLRKAFEQRQKREDA